MHQAVVALPRDVVRRLPDGGVRARPVDPVGRGDDVRSTPMILNDRQGDELLARVRGAGMLVHRPKEGLLALWPHRPNRFNETPSSLGARAARRGNRIAR